MGHVATKICLIFSYAWHATFIYTNSSNLESLASGEGPEDEEGIIQVPQKKARKPAGQCLFLFLVIFAIIASKLPGF